MDLQRRDAYVVAIGPAVVFLGVYAYERGRYYFLKVAPEFIDLSVNRLLAGGAVIGALAVTLVGLTMWMWKYSANGGRYQRLFAAFLALSVFATLPMALWLQEVPPLPASTKSGTFVVDMLAVLAGAVTSYAASASIEIVRRTVELSKLKLKEVEPKEETAAIDNPNVTLRIPEAERSLAGSWGAQLASVLPWKPIGAVALLVWTALVFAGLGYRVERSYESRICAADRFVADVHGDSLLLKSFDPKTGQILSPINVVEINGLDLDTCSPRLVGARGLVLWD